MKIAGFLLDLTDIKKGDKILEFGCGTGAFTDYIKDLETDLDVTGLDISGECIKSAQEKIKGVNFIKGDIERTEFEDNSFDIVIASGVLHHFPDLYPAIKESLRILKP